MKRPGCIPPVEDTDPALVARRKARQQRALFVSNLEGTGMSHIAAEQEAERIDWMAHTPPNGEAL